MGTTIYYFTGTGNSLKVAKDLSNALDEVRLVQISKNNIEEIDSDTFKVDTPSYFGFLCKRRGGKTIIAAVMVDTPSYFGFLCKRRADRKLTEEQLKLTHPPISGSFANES